MAAAMATFNGCPECTISLIFRLITFFPDPLMSGMTHLLFCHRPGAQRFAITTGATEPVETNLLANCPWDITFGSQCHVILHILDDLCNAIVVSQTF